MHNYYMHRSQILFLHILFDQEEKNKKKLLKKIERIKNNLLNTEVDSIVSFSSVTFVSKSCGPNQSRLP